MTDEHTTEPREILEYRVEVVKRLTAPHDDMLVVTLLADDDTLWVWREGRTSWEMLPPLPARTVVASLAGHSRDTGGAKP